MDTSRSFTRSVLPILLILLLAAALRIYHITYQDIWFDEAFAWNIIIQDDMFPRISTDTHPPLYYLMLRGWTTVTGDSPLALRYLSALTSLLTVAAAYRVGRALVADLRGLAWTPLFAALMLALSDAEIFLAQEARNYAAYTLFATLSMWFYLRWLGRPCWGRALPWSVATAALVYTHYQGLFIPAVQGAHALIFLRGRLRLNALAALALAGLPVLPWFLAVTIPQAQNAIDNSLPFAIESSWQTFIYLRDIYLGAVWALMAGLMLLGAWALRERPGRAFLLIAWVLLPFGVLFFGNYAAALLTERKLLIVTPALALLAGLGLARLDRASGLLLAVVLLVYGVSTVDYWRDKEPWAAVAGPALDLGGPADLYLADVAVGQYPMKYYWQRSLPDGAVFATFPFLGDATMAPTTDRPTFYAFLRGDLFPYNQRERVGDVATAWVAFWNSQDDDLPQALEDAGYTRTMTRETTINNMGDVVQLWRYDHLPTEPRAVYSSGLTLLAAEIDADSRRVHTWWLGPTQDDFTISVGLLDESGVLVAQWDGPPPVPTSQLSAPVYDGRVLQPVEGQQTIPQGTHQVIVKVYRWTPETGLVDIPLVDGSPWAFVGTLSIGAEGGA